MSPTEFTDPDEAMDWSEDDDLAWAAERREAAEAAMGAGGWEDYCIRRGDPCDVAVWGDDDPLDFDN